jgi:hypothetical protein
MTLAAATNPIAYLPIATSVLAFAFATVLYRHWRRSSGARYLMWWTIGIFLYGVGAGTEALTTLLEWKEPLFRAWYISGAILGAAPLAQGTAYLMLKRRTADRLTIFLVYFAAIAATFVLLTPIDMSLVDPERLESNVMEWTWVRAFSPLLNSYALVMLGGGAALSAWRYNKRGDGSRNRVWGNTSIAVGTLVVGIGGGFARAGVVEVLYVAEVIGLLAIWWGYRLMVTDNKRSIHASQLEAATASG